MGAALIDADVRTPRVTASVYAILVGLRSAYPNALWNLTCGLDQTECILTIYADNASAWRVRDLVAKELAEARERDGISIVLVVQPNTAAQILGVEAWPI